MRVVVVCTANRCRSPMAAALLARRLDENGMVATVTSAGRLPGGYPAEGGAIRSLALRGLDLRGHRSRSHVEDPAVLEEVDLVLCMAREHLRDVVVADADLFPRTFTLKELVRRGWRAGGRGRDETLREWLARVHQGRSPRDLLGQSPHDDVADPIGLSDAAFEATAFELEALLADLVDLIGP